MTGIGEQLQGGLGIELAQRAAQRSQVIAGPSPKLVHAAHEFEAQMMKELLKPMTEGDALT